MSAVAREWGIARTAVRAVLLRGVHEPNQLVLGVKGGLGKKQGLFDTGRGTLNP